MKIGVNELVFNDIESTQYVFHNHMNYIVKR